MVINVKDIKTNSNKPAINIKVIKSPAERKVYYIDYSNKSLTDTITLMFLL